MLQIKFKFHGCKDPGGHTSKTTEFPALAEEIIAAAEGFFDQYPACRAVEMESVEITRYWLDGHKKSLLEKGRLFEIEHAKRIREKELREALKNHDISVNQFLELTQEEEEQEE